MKKKLNNKHTCIYFIFQIISCMLFFEDFFTYLVVINLCTFYGLVAYCKNKKFESYIIFFVLILTLLYALTSLIYKNPNSYLDNKFEEGYYVIEKNINRTRQMGSLTGRDSVIEPSSYGALRLKSEKTGNIILIECSIMEIGCPFNNMVDKKLYVKYVESKFFSRKYAFYIKGDGVYDESYFKEKYENEFYKKLIFIIFYIGGCFYYIYFSIREKKFF